MLVTPTSDGRGLPVTEHAVRGIPVDVVPGTSGRGVPVTLVANGAPVRVMSGTFNTYSPVTTFGASMLAWWDQSDMATTSATSGSPAIGDRADKSGNARPLLSTGTARPTLIPAARNGLAMAQYDGVDDNLVTGAQYTVAQPMTVFSVYVTAATGRGSFESIFDAGSVLIRPTQGAVSLVLATNLVSFDPVASNTAIVEIVTINGLSTSIRRNGLAVNGGGDAGAGGISASAIAVGGRPGSMQDAYFKGLIGETGLINRVLTTQEMTDLETYLRNKWAI